MYILLLYIAYISVLLHPLQHQEKEKLHGRRIIGTQTNDVKFHLRRKLIFVCVLIVKIRQRVAHLVQSASKLAGKL